MNSMQACGLRDDERRPPASELLEVARHGLALKPKRLPSWLFYDQRGSALFEQICEQPEYYLTRCEIALMSEHAADIADSLGSDVRLVEYGSGSGRKTRMLLRHLREPVSYVPVEISPEPLQHSVQRLAQEFPQLPLQPLCADFSKPLRLPIPPRAPRRTVLYFPGSTIGNFEAHDAVALLRKMRGEMGDAGGLLVGVDLKKDPALIEAAYNDAAGVTAEFTLNMLLRLNREIGSDFDLAAFAHRARYNPMAGRIETQLVSRREQQVAIGRDKVRFGADEAIQVEYSCKYSLEDFAALADKAGLAVQRVWTDSRRMFSVQYLVRAGLRMD
ncbi:MAG: L-histidine N(alpha)-methyltransferase [Rhodanobacter sp.]|jgi:dimethylhistidine N-methyltransferase|nr:L-histidine N(alpha)-methyltransferase [Rhodanobacter sp.]MBN8946342.1 L-histidine N(alpha)-methyltransferase [Rhodanobacter sp.]ODT92668.1 MAG: dimethylhistidine N-methyltransferase [Rhodanobacter sp. SCN 67-45]OJW36226.1 MAG: dimethylhistidine N-methyltransferase [Rhodanobacter sp. 67-28]